MTTAVVMVVKNEEDYIDLAVRSVLGHVDYLYVLDTGSSDKTIEQIRQVKNAGGKPPETMLRQMDFGGAHLKFGKSYREQEARNYAIEETEKWMTITANWRSHTHRGFTSENPRCYLLSQSFLTKCGFRIPMVLQKTEFGLYDKQLRMAVPLTNHPAIFADGVTNGGRCSMPIFSKLCHLLFLRASCFPLTGSL